MTATVDKAQPHRFRCDPCGFSACVVVNGRQRLRPRDFASLALTPCPRCGRRDQGNVGWHAFAAAAWALLFGGAGGWLYVGNEAGGWRPAALAGLCVTLAALVLVVALRRFVGARRAVRFLRD